MADALESSQSENTCKNYASQLRQFRSWCHQENYFALPASPEVVAAYAAEMADDGKSMSTIWLAVAAIVDAHRLVGLESPQNDGVSETLRGLSSQIGVSQKQARPLDADALASVLSDAGLRVSEAVQLRWRDALDTETGAGLVYIERSKTDQAGEGAYVVITPDTLAALKLLRQDFEAWADDSLVFGLSMSQISRRVDSMGEPQGWAKDTPATRGVWDWRSG